MALDNIAEKTISAAKLARAVANAKGIKKYMVMSSVTLKAIIDTPDAGIAYYDEEMFICGLRPAISEHLPFGMIDIV